MDIPPLFFYLAGFVVLLILTQDIHIFPGAFLSRLRSLVPGKRKLPSEIKSEYIQTKDGVALEVWHHKADDLYSGSVAIICHGNGGE